MGGMGGRGDGGWGGGKGRFALPPRLTAPNAPTTPFDSKQLTHMAPELLTAGRPSKAADVYAVRGAAVVMW